METLYASPQREPLPSVPPADADEAKGPEPDEGLEFADAAGECSDDDLDVPDGSVCMDSGANEYLLAVEYMAVPCV